MYYACLGPQKTFTPTIPVRRKKPVTPLPTLAETSNEGAASDERGRDRERRGMGRERGEKGGRGRRDRDIVTSSSIFSMGPAEKLTPKRGNISLFLLATKFSCNFLQKWQPQHLEVFHAQRTPEIIHVECKQFAPCMYM